MTFQKQVVHNIFKDHPKIWQNSSLLQMFHVLDMNQSLKVKKKISENVGLIYTPLIAT